ncbi:MAG: C4-type zinc ribbon domain-containing protein [Candidatus Acidiferrales bacterium]
MLKILQDLLELQSVDVRLHDVRARLATFPKKTAEVDARVAAAKVEVEQSKAAQLATVKDRKKYELDVEQYKERVRKYKDQTAQIKTNEAYKALQHEVQMAEEEIAKAEDRLLEQMVASEEYDRRIKAAEKRLKEVEESARAQRSTIESDKAAADKDLALVEADRARVTSEIPEDMLDHYERIAKKHGGVALAEVSDEKCTLCGMQIRPHVFQKMRRANSEEMFHCETCTRILYYIEPTAVPPVDDPKPQVSGASASSSGEN